MPSSWWIVSVALFSVMTSRGSATAAERPNVIFILTDDQGWGDPGTAGHPDLRRPHRNRLAREGTRFTRFHVNHPVCSPSRTAFMTGQSS